MGLLATYGIFLAKTVTLVLAILVVIAAILSISTKSKRRAKLTVKKVNDRFDRMVKHIDQMTLSKAALKRKKKEKKRTLKQSATEKKSPEKNDHRIFIIRFHGDTRASGVEALREEVTAILLVAQPNDQVLCCLESPGGVVNAYGLAASQLLRVKEAGLKLIVAVDKVAASGGYMMACVADQIIAAPFAIIGSIGVVAQLPNFHRYLQKKNIDFEQLTAGEYKRTLTVFGKNTEKGREKMQLEVDETHALFKDFINRCRPQLKVADVATGEHWYGARALELGLIDRLKISDDYILELKNDYDVYEVSYHFKKTLVKRCLHFAELFISRVVRQDC